VNTWFGGESVALSVACIHRRTAPQGFERRPVIVVVVIIVIIIAHMKGHALLSQELELGGGSAGAYVVDRW
jgi:hypothetical protein